MNGALNIHPKVAGATLAGALAALIVWILGLVGIAVPDVAAAALVTALSGFGGWLAPVGYAAQQKALLTIDGKTVVSTQPEEPAP